jgi:phytoene dehydrogenase-like protein
MTITEEITLPGFKSDVHAFGYQLANLSPAPKELQLENWGFELIRPEISYSHVFPKKNGGYISMYRDINNTLKSIQGYSKKDAQTWKNMFDKYIANKKSIVSSINSPPFNNQRGTGRVMEDFDIYRETLQSMRSWADEWFEAEEVKVMFGSFASFVGLSPDDAGGGELSYLFASVMQDYGNNAVKGGFGNLTMALARYLQSKGGHVITNANVEKIIIKNSRAIGVKLDTGKEIGAKKLVVSSTDPATLILKHIGEEYLEKTIIDKIRKIEWGDAIMAIYVALDGPPRYYVGNEVTRSSQIHLSENTIDQFAKIYYECRSGRLPSQPLAIMSNDSVCDPTRVPSKGKHLIKFLILNVPYKINQIETSGINKDENKRLNNYVGPTWDENTKEQYADQIINMLEEMYISNLKKIMLKMVVYSPIDFETRPSTSVRGTLACGAMVPYQKYSMRPIPELAGYTVPSIPNIYLCGSGSHPGPGVSMAPGRNAAQVIIANLTLDFSKLVGEAS